jgi:hypothetical protein
MQERLTRFNDAFVLSLSRTSKEVEDVVDKWSKEADDDDAVFADIVLRNVEEKHLRPIYFAFRQKKKDSLPLLLDFAKRNQSKIDVLESFFKLKSEDFLKADQN